MEVTKLMEELLEVLPVMNLPYQDEENFSFAPSDLDIEKDIWKASLEVGRFVPNVKKNKQKQQPFVILVIR